MQMASSDRPHTSVAGRISSPSPSPLRFPPRWFPSWSSRAVVHALSSPSLSWCYRWYQSSQHIHESNNKKGRMLGKISTTASLTELRLRAWHFGCGWLTLSARALHWGFNFTGLSKLNRFVRQSVLRADSSHTSTADRFACSRSDSHRGDRPCKGHSFPYAVLFSAYI